MRSRVKTTTKESRVGKTSPKFSCQERHFITHWKESPELIKEWKYFVVQDEYWIVEFGIKWKYFFFPALKSVYIYKTFQNQLLATGRAVLPELPKWQEKLRTVSSSLPCFFASIANLLSSQNQSESVQANEIVICSKDKESIFFSDCHPDCSLNSSKEEWPQLHIK